MTPNAAPTPVTSLLSACQRHPLPIPAAGRKRLLTLLADDDIPLSVVTDALLEEPALALHTYRAAQAQQRQSLRPVELYTIDQCLRLLGLKRLEQLIQKLPVIETPTTPAEMHYLELLMQSRLAGLLARQLATFLLSRQVGEVGLATVLASSPLWQLTLAADETLADCARQQLKGERNAEMVLFGMELTALCRQLAQQADLPALTQESFDDQLCPTLSEWARIARHDPDVCRQWSRGPVAWLIIAQHLAMHLMLKGRNPHLDRALRLYAALQGSSVSKAWLDARQAILAASASSWPSLTPPAAQLVWTAQPEPVRVWIGRLPIAVQPSMEPPALTKPTAVTVPASAPKDAPLMAALANAQKNGGGPEPHPVLVKEMLGVMQVATSAFKETIDVLNFITVALHYAVGLERVVVFALTAQGTRLSVAAHAGLDQDNPLCKLSMALNETLLLGQLMEQNKSLQLDPSTGGKLWVMLPGAVRQGLASKRLVFIPLRIGLKSVALVMIEHATPLSPVQLSAIKAICQQAGQTLVDMVARRRKPSP